MPTLAEKEADSEQKEKADGKPAKPAIAEFAETISAKVGKARQNRLMVIVIVIVIVKVIVRVIVKVIYLIKCSYEHIN